MYLKYIQIVNYKNLRKTRFEFGKGANTVIGGNDSGKSNAMTAMRILLDDDYFYNTKRLKESDFTESLGDWRGHWIIISAFFDQITDIDQQSVTRVLPMTKDVEACFRKIISERNATKVEPIVDGYTGFLYYDKDGSITYSLHWDHYFEHIVDKYNSIYKLQMPEITPHVCRHTYCSNMAKSGMNPKTLQYLMGHADIGTTLNVYTHVNFEDAKAEIEKLNAV